jgi:tape measure domain-containing protein
MADFRIRIIIDPKGAKDGTRVVDRELRIIERRADALRRTLARAFSFAAIAIGVRQLVRLVDVFVNYQNRLRLVTRDSANLTGVMRELFEISNRTRTAFEGTAEVYARLAINQKNLGRTQRELLQFTESLNQAIILSGASAREAKAGLIQLSQGLASNRLSGDELRSVLEQLPAVADVIARQLQVTRGELRRLGEEGKITAAVVLDGFKAAREELAVRFATTIPTVGQAINILKNKILELVGVLNQASGFGSIISQSIRILANNVDLLARAISALIIVLAVGLAKKAIPAVIAGIKHLSLVMASNPLTLLPVVLTTIIALLISFGDKISISASGMGTLQDLAVATFDIIKIAVEELIKHLSGLVTLGQNLDQGLGDSFKNIALVAARVADSIGGVFAGVLEVILLLWAKLPASIERFGQLSLKFLRDLAESTIDHVLALFQTMGDTILSIIRNIGNALMNASQAATQAALGNFEAANQFADDAIQSAKNAVNAIVDIPKVARANLKALQAVDLLPTVEITEKAEILGEDIAAAFMRGFDLTTGAEDTINLLFDNADRRARARADKARKEREAQAKKEDEIRKKAPPLTRQAEQLLKRLSVQVKVNEQMALLNELFKAGAVDVELYNQAITDLQLKVLDASNEFEDGFTRAFIRMKQEAEDLATVGESIVNAFADRATDAITEFARTGQINFREFANAILEDITRIIVRLLIVQALSAAFGGAGNFGAAAGVGALSSSASSGARAEGGTVQPGRSYLVGENGPELFKAEQTGTIVPNQGPQAAPQVNVQVVNVDDPNMVPEAINEGGSDDAIINVLARNRDRVRHMVAQ